MDQVLGVDPGTTQSGVCLLNPKTGEVAAKGVQTFPDLRRFIRKQKASIQLIAIELPVIYLKLVPGSNTALGIMLREVGRLEEVAASLKIPVVLVTRADVLKVVTGRRPSKGHKISKADSQEA